MGRKRAAGAAFGIVGMLALSSCIANSGPFTITMQSGSVMNLEAPDGSVNYVMDIGRPACDDGVDSDADGLVDLADGGCTSATDASERLAGAQAFVKATQPVTIAADGTMTYEPTQMSVPQSEKCLDFGGGSIWCMGLTVKGVGSTQTGSVSQSQVILPLTIKIELDAITGWDGLPADCEIGPISGTFVASTYNTTTGASHMENTDADVPAVTSCGTWNDAINAYLGLPTKGNGIMESTILDANGQPIQIT